MGRYEWQVGETTHTLRKGKKLADRGTKGGAREASLPFVVQGTSLGRYEWQAGETMRTLRKGKELAGRGTNDNKKI